MDYSGCDMLVAEEPSMGTWGPGNFDDDTAADHLSSITARLRDEIVKAMAEGDVELEPDEYWGVAVPCNVELLALLAEQHWVGVVLPDAATVTEWKRRYLAVWDACIDGLQPKPAYRRDRRAALVATFDRLLALVVAREEPARGKKTPARSKKTPAKKKARGRKS
jgi:hypothetical protein